MALFSPKSIFGHARLAITGASSRSNSGGSLDVSTYVPLPAATDRVIRAMSFHKLGDEV